MLQNKKKAERDHISKLVRVFFDQSRNYVLVRKATSQTYLSNYVYLFTYLFICLFVCLFIYLFIYLQIKEVTVKR